MEKFYVYLLVSEFDKSWYIGYSNNLLNRINQHNSGESYYTRRKMPWKLLYYEVSLNKYDAIAREKYLKTGMGRRFLKNRLKHQLDF
jgi:putative endonuclease